MQQPPSTDSYQGIENHAGIGGGIQNAAENPASTTSGGPLEGVEAGMGAEGEGGGIQQMMMEMMMKLMELIMSLLGGQEEEGAEGESEEEPAKGPAEVAGPPGLMQGLGMMMQGFGKMVDSLLGGEGQAGGEAGIETDVTHNAA